MLGLSISLFQPVIEIGPVITLAPIVNYYPDAHFLVSIADQVTSYSHTSGAYGGYESAQFTITCSPSEIEYWLQTGLNLHVVVKNEAAMTVWEGFVNQVSASTGNRAIVRGPLLDAGNRAALLYNLVDPTTRPPTSGVKSITATGEVLASIAQWGVIWKLYTANDMTDAGAADLRDYLLSEDAWPRQTMNINLQAGAGSDPTVTFDCLGYQARLNYPYNQTALTGTTNLSTLLGLVLDDDPNRLFSSANADIATNATQRLRYWNNYMEASTIIKGLTALGSVGSFRCLFMVGPERKVTYARVPATIDYRGRMADSMQRVTTMAGDPVKPWDVQAGKWIQTTDYLSGMLADTFVYLRQDPRNVFIERLTYSAPWDLQIEGGLTDRANQKLARLGLGGR